jgi:hypothetical protein
MMDMFGIPQCREDVIGDNIDSVQGRMASIDNMREIGLSNMERMRYGNPPEEVLIRYRCFGETRFANCVLLGAGWEGGIPYIILDRSLDQDREQESYTISLIDRRSLVTEIALLSFNDIFRMEEDVPQSDDALEQFMSSCKTIYKNTSLDGENQSNYLRAGSINAAIRETAMFLKKSFGKEIADAYIESTP